MRWMPKASAASIRILKTTGCRCRCRWPLTWSSRRPVARNFSHCERISARSCSRKFCLKKYFRPVATGELLNSPRALTRPGIFSGGSAAWPISNVRCRPTPSCGFSFASFTASAKPGSLTIKLALVKMPSRCARMTAAFTEGERPKSSALTISRRFSRLAIAGRSGADGKAQPRLENQRELVRLAQFQRLRAENIKFSALQFLQQLPINGTHQFGGDHGFPVFGRQGFLRQRIKMFCPFGDTAGEREIAVRVLRIQNLGVGDVEFFEFRLRQVNPSARGIAFHVAQNVRDLKRLAEINGVVVAGGIFKAENFNAQQPDDGGDAVAVEFQRLIILITQRVQIHLAA